MKKFSLFACVLALSPNASAAELISYDDIFSVWKAEITASLYDKGDKSILLYEKPELHTLCTTVVRDIEARPNIENYLSIEDELKYRLYSPINKSKSEEYCIRGPYDEWFTADVEISPEEMSNIKSIFDFSDEILKVSTDYDVIFDSSSDDLKIEFKKLRYSDLFNITLDESENKKETLRIVFLASGDYYHAITLRINRDFSKGDVIKVSAVH